MDPDKTFTRYIELCKYKAEEVEYMREVCKYLNPSKRDLVRKDKNGSEVIYDNSGRNILENYTYESLSDVINPFEKWFSLILKKSEISEEEQNQFDSWVKVAEKEFFEFLNDTPYYAHLVADKRNYDLYGFSGMSILTEDNRIKVRAENPYNLITSRDSIDEENVEIYWVVETTAKTLDEKFNYKPEESEKSAVHYKVLFCLVPNSSHYVENPEENKGKYVYLSYYIGAAREHTQDYAERQDEKVYADHEEIGKRMYFDKPFIVCPKDSLETDFHYGVGLGTRLLTGAQNLRQLHKNALFTSAIESNPPVQMPHDTYILTKDGETQLLPGVVFPVSPTGEKIEAIPIRRDFKSLITMLQYENQKLVEDVPQLIPPEKKARQSQFEVQAGQQKAGEIQLIYKLFYLMYGVSKHLDLIYQAGIKLKKISPPPKIFKAKDLQISLSNIILKLYREAKSMGYVRALQLAQPYLTISQESIDNIKPDYIIRDLYKSQGVGDGIEDQEEVNGIREKRQKIRQQQQQQAQAQLALEQQQVSGQLALQQAQADKLKSETNIGA